MADTNVQAVRKAPGPNNRRVYINQRVLRLRDEMQALQKEMNALTDAPKDAKTNHKRIYIRERLIGLREELKGLIAERGAMPKPAGQAKLATLPNPSKVSKPAKPDK